MPTLDGKFSIVMPITKFSYLLTKDDREPTKEHDNFQRFFHVALPCMKSNLVWNDVADFFVITPCGEKKEFLELLKMHAANDIRGVFKVLTEDEVLDKGVSKACRDNKGDNARKSRIQMLVKLLIAKKMRTSAYLVLDDDNVLLRRFGNRELYADKEQKYLKFTSDQAEHPRWWRGSAGVLGYDEPTTESVWSDLCNLRKKNWVVNVTPEVLATTHVLTLLKKLEKLHGAKWQKVMFMTEHPWTEYTIYWLHLMAEGVLKDTYRGSKVRLSDGGTSIWFAVDDLPGKIRVMMDNKRQYFGVIQSNVPEHTVSFVSAAFAEAAAKRQ